MDPTSEGSFFFGFQRDPIFLRLFHRLKALELWRELAIRPEVDCCDPEDVDLMQRNSDDLIELKSRCAKVRQRMNSSLSSVPIETTEFDPSLFTKPSTIPGAGQGLFYEPRGENIQTIIPCGSTICFYTGHLHTYHSVKSIPSAERNYVMSVLDGVLVDPGPLPHVKARFINDPLNEKFVNCKFFPQSFRSAVVATKDISAGEELFASYGDAYWQQHATAGHALNERPIVEISVLLGLVESSYLCLGQLFLELKVSENGQHPICQKRVMLVPQQ